MLILKHKRLLYAAFVLSIVWTGYTFVYHPIFQSTDVAISNDVIESRLSEVGEYFIGKKFPLLDTRNVIDTTHWKTELSGYNIVAVLSRSGCTPAQVRKIKIVSEIAEREGVPFKVIYDLNIPDSTEIYEENDGFMTARKDALLIRKVSRSHASFWVSSESALKKVTQFNYFPVFLTTKNQEIIDAHLPPRFASPSTEEYVERAVKLIREDASS